MYQFLSFFFQNMNLWSDFLHFIFVTVKATGLLKVLKVVIGSVRILCIAFLNIPTEYLYFQLFSRKPYLGILFIKMWIAHGISLILKIWTARVFMKNKECKSSKSSLRNLLRFLTMLRKTPFQITAQWLLLKLISNLAFD